jgi:hypothetical protein
MLAIILMTASLLTNGGRLGRNGASCWTGCPLASREDFERSLAIEAGRGITRRNLQQVPSLTSQARTRRQLGRQGPKKISVARLPVTGSELFAREEDIAYLDDAWANKDVNVVVFYV